MQVQFQPTRLSAPADKTSSVITTDLAYSQEEPLCHDAPEARASHSACDLSIASFRDWKTSLEKVHTEFRQWPKRGPATHKPFRWGTSVTPRWQDRHPRYTHSKRPCGLSRM